jgi:hypothetical protein
MGRPSVAQVNVGMGCMCQCRWVADEHKTIAGVLMAGVYDRALHNTNYLKKKVGKR